ncbi:MAG: hypothetical protein ABSF09_08720 [Candidatus Bathyarchaeia archaeon]|jgi:uncharacterized membrane-anchored protein
MSSNDERQGKEKRKKWLPYLVRGILGVLIAVNLTQQFFTPVKGPNLPIYMGLFFLFNGILSFKEARAEPIKSTGPILAALTSIIGGLAFVIIYPFSPYRQTLVGTDLGRFVFSAIVIIIGLLQLGGTLHITPEPVIKQAHLVFGFLEVLLGIVVMVSGGEWLANTVAFVWVALVAGYMFYVAHRLRSTMLIG